MSLSSPAAHASVAGSPAQTRFEPREPCVRLHIPVVGAGFEISWATELKRAGAGAEAGAARKKQNTLTTAPSVPSLHTARLEGGGPDEPGWEAELDGVR